MKTCTNCQLDFDDKFLFCNKCGGKLIKKTDNEFCPYCGNKIETEGEFCPYCGNLLDDIGQKPMLSYSKNDDSSVFTQSPIEALYINSDAVRSVNTQEIHQNRVDSNTEISQVKEESTFKALIKFILYIIGGFVLFFFIKVIGHGIARASIRNGYGLHLIGGGIILFIFLYFYLNKKE